MKKIIAILLACAFAMSLVVCGRETQAPSAPAAGASGGSGAIVTPPGTLPITERTDMKLTFGVAQAPKVSSYEDNDYTWHNIKRNGCLGCCTDILFQWNHMRTLRHTHPKAWNTFMRMGLAEELRKLQQCRRNGQMSLLDYHHVGYLLEHKPCAFDHIDHLVLADEGWGEVEDAEDG